MTFAIIALAAALAYVIVRHNGKVWKAKVVHVTHAGWEPSAAAWAVWDEQP